MSTRSEPAARDWPAISVIIPTFRREQVLIDTLLAIQPQLDCADELIVIDQTPVHEPATHATLERMAADGSIRWQRKLKPHRSEAMNYGALLAQGDVLLFLDDDVVPYRTLMQSYRETLADDKVPAMSGQVLQPWNTGPVDQIAATDYRFDFAYSKPCEILPLMGCNFAVRRELYLALGGMDENFSGSNYRDDAEIGYRVFRRSGKKAQFVPEGGVRHLHAGGGVRAFGAKDTWGHIGGSIGEYYFALRCLGPGQAIRLSLRRLLRAPINRQTVKRPWLIPSLLLREMVAWCIALWRALFRRNNYLKDLAYYSHHV